MRFAKMWVCPIFLMLAGSATAQQSEPPEQFDAMLADGIRALEANQFPSAVRHANRVLAKSPEHTRALLLRAAAYDRQRIFDRAIADLDRVIKSFPNNPSLYHRRGRSRFKAGDVKGSIVDFDKQISLNPADARRHWERGISYYYDSQYAKGAKQFELYQTFSANDVENVVWQYLCQAKVDGPEKARARMMELKGEDRRVPMQAIHQLYVGRAKPDTVFAAAGNGAKSDQEKNESLFYANLYVGLYYDSIGNRSAALRHLRATEELEISHYMWDVAHLHLNRLRGEQ